MATATANPSDFTGWSATDSDSPEAKPQAAKKFRERFNWPVTIALIAGLVTVVFPLYMTVVIAMKQPSEMTNDIVGILAPPASLNFDNFVQAIEVTNFWQSLLVSALITGVTVVVSVVVHSMAGYVIGRSMRDKKLFRFSYYYIVSGMFVPFAILMMPLVKETAVLHLDNMAGVMLCYIVFYMPMNILLYSGYLKNIPVALEEAARVDGASTWTTFWKIIFPLMKPMHATVAVITALAVWNDVMTPLVIMGGEKITTLPLAQMQFQTQFGTDYNLAFASYLLALLPMLIFYVFAQKQIINGVVNGAVK